MGSIFYATLAPPGRAAAASYTMHQAIEKAALADDAPDLSSA